MTSRERRSWGSIRGRTLLRSKKLTKYCSTRGMQSRLACALYKELVSFFIYFKKSNENMLPDITLRSRIGAHENLDRFFRIIEESFEFLFCSRLARSWNLDFFNLDPTLLNSGAFMNAKEMLELEINFFYHKRDQEKDQQLFYLFPYEFWTTLRSEIDRPNATTRKVGCSCHSLFIIRRISVVE
jgi:hypothetical protein